MKEMFRDRRLLHNLPMAIIMPDAGPFAFRCGQFPEPSFQLSASGTPFPGREHTQKSKYTGKTFLD